MLALGVRSIGPANSYGALKKALVTDVYMPLEGTPSRPAVDRHDEFLVGGTEIKESPTHVLTAAAAAAAAAPSASSLTLPIDRRGGNTSIISAGCLLRATAAAVIAGVSAPPLEVSQGGTTAMAAPNGLFDARPVLAVGSRKRPRPCVKSHAARAVPLQQETNWQQQGAGFKTDSSTTQLQTFNAGTNQSKVVSGKNNARTIRPEAASFKNRASTRQMQGVGVIKSISTSNQKPGQDNIIAISSLRPHGKVSNELKSGGHGDGGIFSAASLSGLIYQGDTHPSKIDNHGEGNDAAGHHNISAPSHRMPCRADPSAETAQTGGTMVEAIVPEEEHSPGVKDSVTGLGGSINPLLLPSESSRDTLRGLRESGGNKDPALLPIGKIGFHVHRPTPFPNDGYATPSARFSFLPAHRAASFLSDGATAPSASTKKLVGGYKVGDAAARLPAAQTAARAASRRGLARRQDENTAIFFEDANAAEGESDRNTASNTKQRISAKAGSLLRLDEIMTAYAIDDNNHHRASSKERILSRAQLRGREGGDGAVVATHATQWQQGQGSEAAAPATAASASAGGAGGAATVKALAAAGKGAPQTSAAGMVADFQRARQLDLMMQAAMKNPVTYEEQIRRERLAHLRMMYTVSVSTGLSTGWVSGSDYPLSYDVPGTR